MQDIINNKELQKDLATQVNEMMLGRLRDIDGLDSVNWWPLAPIWWVIISLFVITFITLIVYYLKRRAWRRSWKGKVFMVLEQMQHKLNQENAHDTLIKLANLIRRIAMHKYSRAECRTLIGKDWLKWLKLHDKKKFDWVKNGSILTEEVFAPATKNLRLAKLNTLINATKDWVR